MTDEARLKTRTDYYEEHNPLARFRRDRRPGDPYQFGQRPVYPQSSHGTYAMLKRHVDKEGLPESMPLRTPPQILGGTWAGEGGLDPSVVEPFLQQIAAQNAWNMTKGKDAEDYPPVMYPTYMQETGLPVRETKWPFQNTRVTEGGWGQIAATYDGGHQKPSEPEISYYQDPFSESTRERKGSRHRSRVTHELGHHYFPAVLPYDHSQKSGRTSFTSEKPRSEEMAHHYFMDRKLAYGNPEGDPYMQAYQASILKAIKEGNYNWQKPKEHADEVIRRMLDDPYFRRDALKWRRTKGTGGVREDEEGYQEFRKDHILQNKIVDVGEGREKPGMFTGKQKVQYG